MTAAVPGPRLRDPPQSLDRRFATPDTIDDVQRIAVVGSGGAGKSTFSRELARRTGLPLIQLDVHHWRPGWVALPPLEWRALQSELIAGERWIVDGNDSGTMDIRFAEADTVIVLALSRWRCLARVLRRWWVHRGRAVQAPGCPERPNPVLLRLVWGYPRTGRRRLETALAPHRSRLRLVELTSPGQVQDFLDRVGPWAGDFRSPSAHASNGQRA